MRELEISQSMRMDEIPNSFSPITIDANFNHQYRESLANLKLPASFPNIALSEAGVGADSPQSDTGSQTSRPPFETIPNQHQQHCDNKDNNVRHVSPKHNRDGSTTLHQGDSEITVYPDGRTITTTPTFDGGQEIEQRFPDGRVVKDEARPNGYRSHGEFKKDGSGIKRETQPDGSRDETCYGPHGIPGKVTHIEANGTGWVDEYDRNGKPIRIPFRDA